MAPSPDSIVIRAGSRRRSSLCGFGGATPHQVLLARIARQGRGSFERGTRFLEAAKFMQQITPHAGEQVITLERRLAQKAVHNRERDIRSLGHADGHRAVEFDDRRTHQTGAAAIGRRAVGRAAASRVLHADETLLAMLRRPGAGG